MAVLSSDDEEYELRDGKNVIGSAQDKCDVVLQGPNVATLHATLDVTQDGMLLTGLNTPVGTYLNGVRILQPEKIVHGDSITFGPTGKIYKLNMALTPSVTKSIASRASDIPPMISTSMQASTSIEGNKRPSRVFTSYRNELSVDNSLRELVERQLNRRSKLSSSLMSSLPVISSLSPSHRNLLEREKLRLSQKLRDIHNVMLGHATINDTYLAANPDDDDELPELSEKPQAPLGGDEDEEDDDLPETVEQIPLQPKAPRPQRTALQQSAIDNRIHTHRIKCWSKTWSAWVLAVQARKQRLLDQKKNTAASKIQRLYASWRLRKQICNRLQRRLYLTKMLRDVAKLHKRYALQTWRAWTSEALIDMFQQHVSQTWWVRTANKKAFSEWKQHWRNMKDRKEHLSRVLRFLQTSTKLRAFLLWKTWRHEIETKATLAKVAEEHNKNKQLVQTMATQSHAEATAWSEQAKEMSQHLQREATLKAEIEELTRKWQKLALVVKVDANVQTENAPSTKSSTLLSHTLLKTVVGEVKEKHLRAVIESLESELHTYQAREIKLNDEIKQLLAARLRQSTDMDELRDRMKQLQDTLAHQTNEFELTKSKHEAALKNAAERELVLKLQIAELEAAAQAKMSMAANTQTEENSDGDINAKLNAQKAQATIREAALLLKLQNQESAINKLKTNHAEQIAKAIQEASRTSAMELDRYRKLLEAAEQKFQSEQKQTIINANLVQTQWNNQIQDFLEEMVTQYDLRLLRVSNELEQLINDKMNGAQFRAASQLVGYAQEERLNQYKVLSKLYDQLLQSELDNQVVAANMEWTQNGQFLHEMLLQRFHRLHQLHESLAQHSATMEHGLDSKKLEYAKFLAQTMHTRQTEFVTQAASIMHQIARAQAHRQQQP
ncbi:hypothetical protein LEN26_021306 [Aphanomyces euteiches]|nr:hypothetical protein LEN26_021306 [Aphanomyces euteiches]KAH9115481.1 hypothetical protein AeMF1_010496 [Aphanomyces euteiches]KAH9190134.1 hypothetical protein AeNC1_007884 [Aphanomyces euteiches]